MPERDAAAAGREARSEREPEAGTERARSERGPESDAEQARSGVGPEPGADTERARSERGPEAGVERARMEGEFLLAMRRTGSTLQLLGQVAAERIGVNATDLNCLNLVALAGPR